MQNLFSELENILKDNEKYFTEKGLLKNKITELALKSDKDLLLLLLNNQVVKNHFFTEIDINDEKALVFDKEKFISFINNKEFLPGSYTSFKNQIGLKTKNKLLVKENDDVSLVWPYKDCVLEGGQDFEDQKRNEIFYNETLSPDEIDRLFEPKVLTNFKKINKKTSNGVEEITSFNDNLIIKGNNLIVLHCLKNKYRNKVKLIYIDPPYNRNNDSFKYNDKFTHSTWLTFIKNRLEIARELLREDGSIWINIDDNESHYLKVLCDGVFGRDNFVANIIWQKKYTISNDAKFFSDNHDNILVFAKNIERFKIKGIKRSDEQNKRYTNIDNDPRGPWMSQPLHAKSGLNNQFSFKFNNGFVWRPPRGTYPRYSKDTLTAYEKDNRIWFGKNGTSVPRVKKYLNEMSDVRPATIWLHSLAGNNDQANREVVNVKHFSHYFGKYISYYPGKDKSLLPGKQFSYQRNWK